MSIKFSRATNARLSTPDNETFALPNANWALGVAIAVDGTTSITDRQIVFSTGPAQDGTIALVYDTANKTMGVTLHGSSTLYKAPANSFPANGEYVVVIERTGFNVNIRWAPISSTAPVDGSSVTTLKVTETYSEFDGVGPVMFGTQSGMNNSYSLDHTLARAFQIDGNLTALEIARLAYGEEITGIGKTPKWYVRMNAADDINDVGPQAVAFTPINNPTTGAAMGFGYQAPQAPTFTSAPAVNEPVIENAPVSFTGGTVTGSPAPTVTQQWTIDGADIAGATGATYIPPSASVGKALRVRQIATNTGGSTSSTSAPVTVAAYVVPPSGAVTNDYPPDGQSKRYAGTANNATGGSYTFTGSAGGVTATGNFPVANGAFDFTVTALQPGSYAPTLTLTGPGGTAGVTGASGFSIASVGGGGELPDESDTTAPTITAAAVASSAPGVVVLTASEPLDTASVPATSAFTVTGHTVSSVAIQSSAINLTVTPVFANGEAPRTVSYTVPGTNPVRDLASPANAMAAFSGVAITNNVAAPIATVTGVTISPAAVTVAGGATQTFTATARGTNNPAQSFTWTRNPAVGTITGNGTANGSLVAPAATNVAQTIEVTATSTQDPNFSAKAVVTVPAAAPAGTNFTRSLARTIKVKPAPQMFEGGPFWNTSNKTRPVGTIDKDETIDVSFDLTDVLADISDTVKKIDFDLAGLTSVGGYFTGAVATVFVSNAVALGGGKNPTITCRMTTNSTPARIEDWTVELKIEEQ